MPVVKARLGVSRGSHLDFNIDADFSSQRYPNVQLGAS